MDEYIDFSTTTMSYKSVIFEPFLQLIHEFLGISKIIGSKHPR